MNVCVGVLLYVPLAWPGVGVPSAAACLPARPLTSDKTSLYAPKLDAAHIIVAATPDRTCECVRRSDRHCNRAHTRTHIHTHKLTRLTCAARAGVCDGMFVYKSDQPRSVGFLANGAHASPPTFCPHHRSDRIAHTPNQFHHLSIPPSPHLQYRRTKAYQLYRLQL